MIFFRRLFASFNSLPQPLPVPAEPTPTVVRLSRDTDYLCVIGGSITNEQADTINARLKALLKREIPVLVVPDAGQVRLIELPKRDSTPIRGKGGK